MQPTEPNITSSAVSAEMKEKRINWPVIILTLTTLLFAGLAVFFGIEYFKAKSSQHIEGEPGLSVGDNTPSAPLNGGEITNGAGDVSDTSVARDRVLTFDETKIQNAVAGVNYAMVTNRCENDVDEHGSALCISVDGSDPTKVHISLDRTTAVRQYGSEVGPADYTVLHYDVEFDQKVKSIYLAGEGQDGAYDTVLYLLEDGTVAYAPVINAIKKASFRSIGILEGVTDAAKFYTLYNGGGFLTAYQKTNGDIYILTLGAMNVDSLANNTYYGVMQ